MRRDLKWTDKHQLYMSYHAVNKKGTHTLWEVVYRPWIKDSKGEWLIIMNSVHVWPNTIWFRLTIVYRFKKKCRRLFKVTTCFNMGKHILFTFKGIGIYIHFFFQKLVENFLANQMLHLQQCENKKKTQRSQPVLWYTLTIAQRNATTSTR